MAMTASVMTADRQKITDAGFDAFQSKPLKVSDFRWSPMPRSPRGTVTCSRWCSCGVMF